MRDDQGVDATGHRRQQQVWIGQFDQGQRKREEQGGGDHEARNDGDTHRSIQAWRDSQRALLRLLGKSNADGEEADGKDRGQDDPRSIDENVRGQRLRSEQPRDPGIQSGVSGQERLQAFASPSPASVPKAAPIEKATSSSEGAETRMS